MRIIALFAAVFLLGFGKFVLAFPFIIFYFVCIRHILFKTKIGYNFVLLNFLIVFFLASVFGIGSQEMTLGSPFKLFLIYVSKSVVIGLLLLLNPKMKNSILGLFVSGIFFQNLLIIGYSYWIDPVRYGYNLLLNPFSGQEHNSGGCASAMANSFVYFSFLVFFENNRLCILLGFLLSILCLIGGLFLGSRTFFLVIFMTVMFFALVKFLFKEYYRVLFFSCIAILILFFLVSSSYELSSKLLLFEKRIDYVGISSTGRTELWAYGLETFAEYPFGGIPMDKIGSKWLHNIFFDTFRVAGWFPLIPLFILYLLGGIGVILAEKRIDSVLPICYVILIGMEMMIDIVLEGPVGGGDLLIVFFLSNIIILSLKKPFHRICV